MIRWVLLVALLAGCGGNSPPPELPPYDQCVLGVVIRAGIRAKLGCAPTGWAACPTREQIRSEFQADRLACTGNSLADEAFDKSMALALPAP